ncbi:MAG: ABC transporter permease [Acidobacteriota bacterium]
MGWLNQTLAITGMSLRTIPRRLGASLSAAIGVAGVVAVMVAVLSIAEGFRATLARTGSPDTALVLRSGSDSEMSSTLPLAQSRIIRDAPGILRGEMGPVVSAELFVIVDLPKRSTGTKANVPLRGVEPGAFDVREKVRIVEGRRFDTGRNELIVGTGARDQFVGLDLGHTIRLGAIDWEVVGIFSAGGALNESEMWCDANVLRPAYHRDDTFQSMYARMESPASFETLKDALTTDPRLSVKVIRAEEYYASQSDLLHALVTGLGTLVAALMAIGAVFGAINTMYSAVAARTREIATLRALGFGGRPVILSVLCESLLISLCGGMAGGIGAYLAFNGYQAATLNWQSFSQVVFAFQVTPGLLLAGLLASLLMGLLGGLLPAVRAARTPVATALRQL